MISVDKLEDWNIWQKAHHINEGLERAAADISFDKEVAIREQLVHSGEIMMRNISKSVYEDHPISSLTNAKKASQKARSSVYDALETNCLSKEDFDYFYNELAHLSSSIGKEIIDLKFHR